MGAAAAFASRWRVIMTPYFANFADFIAMGGHAFYVWLCYGFVFLAVVGMIVYAKAERNMVLKKLKKRQSNKRLTNKQRRTN
ncbi:heme exporter protein D [Moraxella cuniculi DSM 21768]|uniref:Heme exporter protein D n=2 Tax=Moraxella cuniculi TaxID=34061 RepID=A0A1N7EB95_9GAMM|nr:heme exporter protein D [Moraxella cuniculi DSM 21768]